MSQATDNPTPNTKDLRIPMSRRNAVNLLVGGAAAAVGAAPRTAGAMLKDPAFAAIDRHRAEIERCDRLFAAYRAARFQVLGSEDDVCERLSLDEILCKLHAPEPARTLDAWNAASDDLFLAERALVETEPLTVAGASALLRYAAELEQSDGDDGWEWLNYEIQQFSPQDARINLLLTVAAGLSRLTGHV